MSTLAVLGAGAKAVAVAAKAFVLREMGVEVPDVIAVEPPRGQRSSDQYRRSPLYQSYSLELEHQFFWGLALRVGYVGGHGRNLPDSLNINQLPDSSFAQGAPLVAVAAQRADDDHLGVGAPRVVLDRGHQDRVRADLHEHVVPARDQRLRHPPELHPPPQPTLAAPYVLPGPVDTSVYGYGREANPAWT